jgi:hypothetical protein
LDITYCYEECPIGKAACEELLKLNNSAIDAAIDFDIFTENCFKTCLHKNMHEKINN